MPWSKHAKEPHACKLIPDGGGGGGGARDPKIIVRNYMSLWILGNTLKFEWYYSTIEIIAANFETQLVQNFTLIRQLELWFQAILGL